MMNEHAQIGPYTLQRLLGGGGMADVYLAWDSANRWPVALKLLRAAGGQDARMLKRFEREAATLMKLRHPHIIQVYDAGQTDDGRPYIAMEYVTGGDLVDLLQQRKGNKLAVSEALYLMRRVAGAMAYAHERGIVHRDLKPGNVLLRADTGEPVIADLGIAALAGAKPLTGTMEALGTPQYMAPEQGTHHGAADGRADIYAIGVMLYEMLTGRLPFEGDNGWALLLQKQQEDAPPVLGLRRDLDPRLAAVVDACLRRDPAARFQTAGALAAALDAFLPADARPPAPVAARRKKDGGAPTPLGPLTPGGAAGSTRQATPVGAARTQRRSPLGWLIAALALGLLAVGAVILWPRLSGGPAVLPAPTAVAAVTAQPQATADLATDAPAAVGNDAGAPATSTTAPTTAPPTDTPPPAALPANLPVAEIVAPADGATLPAGQPVAILIAAGDAVGLAGLTVEVNGRRLAEFTLDGETLFTRTVDWDAPVAGGEAVFTVWAVNVDGVPGEPQSIAVTLEAEEEPTATAAPTRAATTATSGGGTAPATRPAATAVAVVAATPAGPGGPTTVLNFEAFGNWHRGDQANGNFTQSSEQSRGGFAAKYEYNFPGPDNDFVVFSQLRDMAGQPNALTLWVYGDGSGSYLNAWIIDDEGQAWSAPFGRVQHIGWQQMTAPIDAEQDWPGGHVYGPDNGEIDYPIRFSSFVLDDAANDYTGQGTIYLDDLVATTLDE